MQETLKRFMEYDFPIKEVQLACFVAAGTGKAVHQNRPNHGVAFHTEGEKEYRFADGTRLLVRANDLIFLPQGSDYTVIPYKPGDCYAINFSLADAADFAPFAVPVKNAEPLLDAFRGAARAWKSKKPAYRMVCKELLCRVLALLQQEHAPAAYLPSKLAARIDPALAVIREKGFSDPLNVADLAALCGMSPEYFRAIFRKIYGTSPKGYLARLRLLHAKELILSDLYSISEAAALAGYADISYFSREFKKAFGYPPRECRFEK